jgi:hypothetical protein
MVGGFMRALSGRLKLWQNAMPHQCGLLDADARSNAAGRKQQRRKVLGVNSMPEITSDAVGRRDGDRRLSHFDYYVACFEGLRGSVLRECWHAYS